MAARLAKGLLTTPWAPGLVYALVSLIVLGPLLRPGFILTFDMVFGPHIKLAGWFYGRETDIWGELPVWGLMAALSYLAPLWLVQKWLLFAILFLAGYSAHRLSPAHSLVGKYFAGLLYVLNPFVYVRFMAGQWQLLAGYALAPLAIKAAIALAHRPRLKAAAVSAALLSLVGMFSPHMMALVLAASLVIMAFPMAQAALRQGGQKALLPHFQFSLIFLALAFALSFYWLLPAFTYKAAFLSPIGDADRQVFSARPLTPGGSVFLTLASLHGFWRAGYSYINQWLPGWHLLALFFMFLAVLGFLARRRRDERLGHQVKAIGALGILSWLLASGASSYFSPVYDFLFDKLFFFRAFRDSQKFVALLVLAYSYLGGLGAEELYRQLRPRLERPFGKLSERSIGVRSERRDGVRIADKADRALPRARHRIASVALAAIALASPFAYSLNMLGGFGGQLKSVHYPPEWHEANSFLNGQPGDFTVLFLPWHGFMTFSWAGQRLATPARWFFDRPVLQSQSLEIGSGEKETEPAQRYLGFLLENKSRLTNLGGRLAPLNIKYIILAREADYLEYDFLFRQTDLKVVLDNPRLALLENLHPVAPRLLDYSRYAILLLGYIVSGVSWVAVIFLWYFMARRNKSRSHPKMDPWGSSEGV